MVLFHWKLHFCPHLHSVPVMQGIITPKTLHQGYPKKLHLPLDGKKSLSVYHCHSVQPSQSHGATFSATSESSKCLAGGGLFKFTASAAWYLPNIHTRKGWKLVRWSNPHQLVRPVLLQTLKLCDIWHPSLSLSLFPLPLLKLGCQDLFCFLM